MLVGGKQKMKKNRNSFFSESNASFQGFNPNMNMMGNVPYQASTAYNSFYAGNPSPNMMGMPNDNDLESRLAKIERQINRLDHRISKLESTSNTLIDDYDTNTTNMYML